jgi:hypothetical protein
VARETAYRFLSAVAGDLRGFEEISRALFSGNKIASAERMAAKASDVRNYAFALARPGPTVEQPTDA